MSILKTRTIKEMVMNNQKVTFRFYRDGQLWYATECGFEFPVPISEPGKATLCVLSSFLCSQLFEIDYYSTSSIATEFITKSNWLPQ